MSKRFTELLDEAHNPKPDVSADEVITKMKTKLRALGKKHGK